MSLILYGQVQTSLQSLPRITEGSDSRITESGDRRITDDIVLNTTFSSIIASSLVIPFQSTLYLKYNGTWKVSNVYIKYNDNWIFPISIHKKDNNIWKRVL